MNQFEQSICMLVRAGHANVLAYPLSLYFAAFDELREANKAEK